MPANHGFYAFPRVLNDPTRSTKIDLRIGSTKQDEGKAVLQQTENSRITLGREMLEAFKVFSSVRHGP